jgi:hypothetical protein
LDGVPVVVPELEGVDEGDRDGVKDGVGVAEGDAPSEMVLVGVAVPVDVPVGETDGVCVPELVPVAVRVPVVVPDDDGVPVVVRDLVGDKVGVTEEEGETGAANWPTSVGGRAPTPAAESSPQHATPAVGCTAHAAEPPSAALAYPSKGRGGEKKGDVGALTVTALPVPRRLLFPAPQQMTAPATFTRHNVGGAFAWPPRAKEAHVCPVLMVKGNVDGATVVAVTGVWHI